MLTLALKFSLLYFWRQSKLLHIVNVKPIENNTIFKYLSIKIASLFVNIILYTEEDIENWSTYIHNTVYSESSN